MHPKFKPARIAAGFVGPGSGFRIPSPDIPTGPCEEPFHAMFNAALTYMLNHPAYQKSAIAILEMGVADGKVRKRVNKKTGWVSYTYALMALRRNK